MSKMRKIKGNIGEYGIVYLGESGGFTYLQFVNAPKGIGLFTKTKGGITLDKVTFDFSGCGLHITDAGWMVPHVSHGVDQWKEYIQSNDPAIFGFTAIGFNPGDDLLLQAPRIAKADNLPPTSQDLFGGKLILGFSDGQKITAHFSTVGRNSMSAIATF